MLRVSFQIKGCSTLLQVANLSYSYSGFREASRPSYSQLFLSWSQGHTLKIQNRWERTVPILKGRGKVRVLLRLTHSACQLPCGSHGSIPGSPGAMSGIAWKPLSVFFRLLFLVFLKFVSKAYKKSVLPQRILF